MLGSFSHCFSILSVVQGVTRMNVLGSFTDEGSNWCPWTFVGYSLPCFHPSRLPTRIFFLYCLSIIFSAFWRLFILGQSGLKRWYCTWYAERNHPSLSFTLFLGQTFIANSIKVMLWFTSPWTSVSSCIKWMSSCWGYKNSSIRTYWVGKHVMFGEKSQTLKSDKSCIHWLIKMWLRARLWTV